MIIARLLVNNPSEELEEVYNVKDFIDTTSEIDSNYKYSINDYEFFEATPITLEKFKSLG